MEKRITLKEPVQTMPGGTDAEKRHLLYLQQKETLDAFLQRGALSKAQYDKSLHDLREKMHESE
ncbi:MAG: hypothetical protein IJP98_04575 [Clostridia bacterium]|nr:hypothetical protein [Clostridia bacterium]